MTVSVGWNPSISDKIWLSVCSRLVRAATVAGAAHPADGVDLVDEDDARRVFFRGPEHVPHSASTHTDEHLNELAAADGEERHIRFAGDGFRQKRLPGARRADEQHALGHLRADPREFAGVFQVIDHLRQFALGVLHSGHVFKRDAALPLLVALGRAANVIADEPAPHRVAKFGQNEHHEHRDEGQSDQQIQQDRPQPRGRLVAALDDDGIRHRLVLTLQLRAVRLVGLLDIGNERPAVVGLGQVHCEPPGLPELEGFRQVAVRIAHLALGAVGADELDEVEFPLVSQCVEVGDVDLAVAVAEGEERERDHRQDDEYDPPSGEQRITPLGGRLRGGGGGGDPSCCDIPDPQRRAAMALAGFRELRGPD